MRLAAEHVAKAEKVAQDIAEIGERGLVEALCDRAVYGLVAIAVVGGALLRIAQHA